MKSNLLFFIALVSAVVSACSGSKYEFWETSHFKIVPGALPDSQSVNIVYCSRGPDVPEKLSGQLGVVEATDGEGNRTFPLFILTEYYVHYVVVRSSSKDTFNILTPEGIEVSQGSKETPFMYTLDTDPSKKMMYNRKMRRTADGSGPSEFELPTFNRVARDPSFDHVADNDFPTVIGFVQQL